MYIICTFINVYYTVLHMAFMNAKGWPAGRTVGQAANLRLFRNVMSCCCSNSVCRELAQFLELPQ